MLGPLSAFILFLTAFSSLSARPDDYVKGRLLVKIDPQKPIAAMTASSAQIGAKLVKTGPCGNLPKIMIS